MAAELDLYVADNSLESPQLSECFLTEVLGEKYCIFDSFLSAEEKFMLQPNSYGEIIFGKKREPSFWEKAKAPLLLNKALKGEISAQEINRLRDKFINRSEKIEDRERDPHQLKKVLKKVETQIYKLNSSQANFIMISKNAIHFWITLF